MTTTRLISSRGFVTAARTYDEALSKLTALPSNQSAKSLFEPGAAKKIHGRALKEMTDWLARAGYQPSDLSRMRTVHVAGSKGKGTVCALVTAMLLRSGGLSGPVGTYTSPHLVTPRERIAVDGSALSRQDFADAVFDLDDRLAAFGPERPFFFRFMTLLAWHVFLSRQIQHVVMECGIGGEHDATNILPPEAVSATVITQLDHDHVAMLGDSLESIAWHKAGIMKAGVRCFALLPDDAAAAEVLRARAEERRVAGGEMVELNDDLLRAWPDVDDEDTHQVPSTNRVRKANQALAALAVREHLGLTRPNETPLDALSSLTPTLLQGMRRCRLRGRREVLFARETEWLLDVAHTPLSIEAVGSWAATEGHSLVLIFGVQPDRDPEELLRALHRGMRGMQSGRSAFVTQVFFVGVGDKVDESIERARDAMRQLQRNCSTSSGLDVEYAIMYAERSVEFLSEVEEQPPQKVLVTGSMRLVGDALRILDPGMPS
ncbi:folylpolyglutamate synthase [Ophiocordyceps camponoti-floridani]|uniref:tetrahydrofolate synthase n=1 Tax=Ophiocordyceps camponoti-floridani TaxID=2030778 RepID=A0A8H4QA49_9HYPO|nr:folylpolyglutamate synthase [Ophiocordyceps camponoti-floridani]